MAFIGTLIVSIFLLYGSGYTRGAAVDCPTPISPENGQSFLHNRGKIVRYVCNPAFVLRGEPTARCIDSHWSFPAPICHAIDKEFSASEQSKELVKDPLALKERPLFSWGAEKENMTENDTSSDMANDEARMHMVLYPERVNRRVRILPSRIRTAAVRVQSGSELEEEQKKRSKEESTTTIELQPPSVVYVRKSMTPGKALIYDDTLRRQYELAALHVESEKKPDDALVSLPRAAVSTDGKGEQSDEALRQMYIMAHNYMYPRQAVVDPSNNPVVFTLSESQMQWINSLHPELRDRYLQDIYTTRAKEAEEGARAMEFLRRYDDVYNVFYNRPYYVRQPVAVVMEDPLATYDYSCHQANYYGGVTTIPAPQLRNAVQPRLESRRNPHSPYNYYLSATYRCRKGYRLRNPRNSELFCSERTWVGERPICDYTEDNIEERNCNLNKGGCEQICYGSKTLPFIGCSCQRGFFLAPDKTSCIKNDSKRKSCYVENGGCQQKCYGSRQGSFISCACKNGFYLASDGTSCIDVNECDQDNFGCSHECINTRGSAICKCPTGLILEENHKICQVEYKHAQTPTTVTYRHRTCAIDNGGCQQICQNSDGGYFIHCGCHKGYQLSSDEISCIDVDECAVKNGGCQGTCVNLVGHFRCSCPKGFISSTKDIYSCDDINECETEELNTCHHICNNTVGSYTCSCFPGYLLTEDNACEGCRKNSYRSDSRLCEECPSNSHTISEGKSSIADCLCDNGYIGDPSQGIPCTDKDECQNENFGCSDSCVNTPGSAYCSCPNGFNLEADEKTCVDVDECAVKNGGCQGTCLNLVGHFQCSCPAGFISSTKDIYSCDDIDECTIENGHCSHVCNNYPGGHFCSCEVGFRLDISQTSCIAVTCPRIAEPHHSIMRCNSTPNRKGNSVEATVRQDFPSGTTCTFKCKAGYKLSSTRDTIACNENGQWEGAIPECVVLQCPALKAPSNGYIEPEACSKSGSNVLRKCTVICHPGYKLIGNPVFTCKRHLSWSPNILPICKEEKILPHLTCAPDITLDLPLGMNSVLLQVPPPFANVEAKYISTFPSWATDRNASFSAGVTEITYSARSPTAPNVTVTCTTTIVVIDREPPVILKCPASFDAVATAFDGATVEWEEPIFVDNVEVTSIMKTLEPNVTLSIGIHAVKYTARDAAGNIADCLFFINITSVECGDPIGPLHGEANCMDWAFGHICQPTCHPGYIFYTEEPPFHMCDDTGIWTPSRNIPECIKFSVMIGSECPQGSEFRIHAETNETICVECPSDMIWSEHGVTCMDYSDFTDW